MSAAWCWRGGLLAKVNASIDPALIANAVPARGPAAVKDKSLKKPPRARFVKGDRVRGRNLNPSGHTRLCALCPRQVRSDRARLGRVGLCRHQSTSRRRQAATLFWVTLERGSCQANLNAPRAGCQSIFSKLCLEPIATEMEIAKRNPLNALEKSKARWR